MNENSNVNQAASAVQESLLNLIELVEQAARTQSETDVEVFREEARKTTLMIIATIVLADNKYDAGEEAFVRLLVDASQKDDDVMNYLKGYAEKWKAASLCVPRFFQLALEHDAVHQTDLGRRIIREIHIIGNYTCVSGGCFEANEHEIIRSYILFLEEYLSAWRAQHQGQKTQIAHGWTSI
jgi:hypothetical protein